MPVWPKCSTPSERVRWPCTAPSQRSVAGWPSMTVTSRAMARQVGEQRARYGCARGRAALARPRCAAVQPALSRSAEVTASSADVAPVLGHQPDGLDRLRRDRALIGDDHLAFGPGGAQPIAAVDDVCGERRRRCCARGCSIGRVESRR